MSNSTLKHTLFFIRGLGENIIVAHITVPASCRTEEAAVNLLGKALENWMAKTEEGKAADRYASGDFNMGDLSTYVDSEGPIESLAPFLSEMGIAKLEIAGCLSHSNQFAYDKVLAARSDDSDYAAAA